MSSEGRTLEVSSSGAVVARVRGRGRIDRRLHVEFVEPSVWLDRRAAVALRDAINTALQDDEADDGRTP
jgi:hypothetical protein